MVAGAEATDRPRQGFLIFHFFSVLSSVERVVGNTRVLRSFERIDARKVAPGAGRLRRAPLYGRIGDWLERRTIRWEG